MSKYNAEQFIVENLVELPKTKKEMIWCLNEFLKDTIKSISDDEIEKSSNGADIWVNAINWYKNKLLKK